MPAKNSAGGECCQRRFCSFEAKIVAGMAVSLRFLSEMALEGSAERASSTRSTVCELHISVDILPLP